MLRKSWFVVICVVLSMSLCLSGMGFAKGGGGSSGGFSSGSRSSGGWGSGGSTKSTPAAPSKSWGSGSGGKWGSDVPTVTTPPRTATDPKGKDDKGSGMGVTGRDATKSTITKSPADKALYEKAKMSGTTFKTRDEAVKDFQTKNAAKYANKFSTEPKVRPDYIPGTTIVGGHSYTVIYNPGMGGYGYYNGASWIMYDAMRDAAMMSMLMNQNHYYYGAPPASDGGFLVLFFILLVVVIAVGGGVIVYRRY